MRELNILIIDDSPEDRYSYKRMIAEDSEHVYHIIEAEDAADGLAILRSTPMDCVMLDYNLPDMDGLTFLNEMPNGSEERIIPVIFLTGQGSEAIAVQAMKSGASDYLTKGSLNPDLLVRTIRHAVENRDARRALTEKNVFLNTLIETIPNPIFYRDTNGHYLGCNKAFETFLGMSRQDIIGKSVGDLPEPHSPKNYLRDEEQLFKAFGTQTVEGEFVNARGSSRNMIASKASFVDAKGDVKGLVGVLVDITEQKQMEAALRTATEELKENVAKLQSANRKIVAQQKAVIEEERLKVLLQMAGATAHELNQPLVQLMGYIDLFAFDIDDPEKVASHLAKIKAAGNRIADIARKIQSIRLEECEPVGNRSAVYSLDEDIRVLVVEDSDEDFDRIAEAVACQKRINLDRARDAETALDILSRSPIDLLILDYLLPSGNGLDFLAILEERKINTPVIFSTGHGDEVVAAKAIQAGAYDYLPKVNVDTENLMRMIVNTLEKYRLKAEVSQAVKKMADMSVRDELTGMYNRRYMNEVMEREFSRAHRYGTDLSCLLIDMDFFKQINDSFGHIFGDFVLKTFASHMQENFRESDFCFRYGGEEFLVLLPNTAVEGANNTAEKLRQFVQTHPFDDGQYSVNATISIGSVSLKKHQPSDVKTMLAYADKALYRAKSEGRNRLNVYMDISSSPDPGSVVDIDLSYFRERLSSILKKNREAAMNSLSLLMDQLGAERFKEHHQKALTQIDVLCQKMRIPTTVIDTIKRAAMLHDHLKVLLPASVMEKQTPLDEEEKAYMQYHATMLAEVTRLFEFFRNERDVLLYHQERFDGTGYPSGLKGDQIPLGARIYALADAVTAMMSERPYREPLTARQIAGELMDNAGTQFDPNLVRLFIDALDDNPILELSEKELGALKAQFKKGHL